MSPRRRWTAIVLGLAVVGATFVTAETTYEAITSPVFAISLSGIATALTLDRPKFSFAPRVRPQAGRMRAQNQVSPGWRASGS